MGFVVSNDGGIDGLSSFLSNILERKLLVYFLSMTKGGDDIESRISLKQLHSEIHNLIDMEGMIKRRDYWEKKPLKMQSDLEYEIGHLRSKQFLLLQQYVAGDNLSQEEIAIDLTKIFEGITERRTTMKQYGMESKI